jgi:pullulanase/glycogen debranching enzyme
MGLVKLYESHGSMETKEERHENRKKVMKGPCACIYTGQAKPNEKKWKGWSDGTQKQIEAVVGEMEDDAKGGMAKRFDAAYRRMVLSRVSDKKNKTPTEQYKPRTNKVWGFDDKDSDVESGTEHTAV